MNVTVVKSHEAVHKMLSSFDIIISFYSSQKMILKSCKVHVSKGEKIRNRYNQVPHLTKDINGKVTNSQLDTTNEVQESSPFPAGDHKARINRRTQRHSKHRTKT